MFVSNSEHQPPYAIFPYWLAKFHLPTDDATEKLLSEKLPCFYRDLKIFFYQPTFHQSLICKKL